MGDDKTSVEDQLKELTFEVGVLRRRVRSLEQYGIALIGAATIALLLCGTFLPMWTETHSFDYSSSEEADPEVWSLGFIVAKMATGDEEVSSGEDLGLIVNIGFFGLAAVVGLLVIVVVPLLTVPSDDSGPMSRRRSIVFKTLVVLGVVGSVVPLLLSGMALTTDGSEAGWGGVVLCAGMAVSAWLVFGPLGALKPSGSGALGTR